MIKHTNKKIKSKIIDALIHLKNPSRLMRFVIIANNIETVILDVQEQYPKAEVTRDSVIKWYFMTKENYQQLELEIKEQKQTKSPNQ